MISKRSLSDSNVPDKDVHDLLNDNDDGHWLWSKVKRIRRSIEKLLSNENVDTHDQHPTKKSHKKAHSLNNDGKHPKHKVNHPRKVQPVKRSSHHRVERPRRNYEDDDDEDIEDVEDSEDPEDVDEDDGSGTHVTELIDSANHVVDNNQNEKLCEFRVDGEFTKRFEK